MPRARSLKPGFFKNEELAALGFPAMLLYEGLWVLADREGRLEDRPKRIKAEIFPYSQLSIEPLLEKLHRSGFILRYEAGGNRFIAIPTWKKHQNPHVKECPSTIPAPCSTLYQHSTKTPSSLTPSSLTPDSLNPEPGAGAGAPPLDLSDAFASLWRRHPKHQKLHLAEQALTGIVGPLPAEMQTKLLVEIEAGHKRQFDPPPEDPRFVPSLDRWLLDRRWTDERVQEAPRKLTAGELARRIVAKAEAEERQAKGQ